MATSIMPTAGSLTDVPGVVVGHHQRRSAGWRTGTTVVLTPDGAVGGVDVRGGGPGTRETDLLRPENLVQRVHGVCLSGGSAFGLAAADGVMAHLASLPAGFPVGDDPRWVVPIVPAAVIFDLGRGGRFHHHPDAEFGRRAARRASRSPVAEGSVGAGTGAVSGGLQGGVGSASVILGNGVVVAALAVVNSSGTVVDPDTVLPWEAAGHHLRSPSAADRRKWQQHVAAVAARLAPPANTTIGVVATSAALSKAECSRLATAAHDGLARAVRPAHSLNDGDTVFSLATGHHELRDPLGITADASFRSPASRASDVNELLVAAAQTFAAACVRAILLAESSAGGHRPPCYADLVPSAFGDRTLVRRSLNQ